MKMSCKKIEVPILRDTVKCYTAHLGFGDYDKIFAFVKWRCPVSCRVHCPRWAGINGIEALYADGTSDWLSFCQIRDAIERNWEYMREVLKEDQDLSEYSETIGDHETLTLRCSTINFRISDSRGVALDRIWGKVRYEYAC